MNSNNESKGKVLNEKEKENWCQEIVRITGISASDDQRLSNLAKDVASRIHNRDPTAAEYVFAFMVLEKFWDGVTLEDNAETDFIRRLMEYDERMKEIEEVPDSRRQNKRVRRA